MIRMPGERVWSTHQAPGLVVQREVEPGQVQRPPRLPLVEVLRLPGVLQVLVVGPDLDWVLRALEEMSPFPERPDDHEHLLVVGLVVTLDRAQAFGEERDRVPLALGALLGGDGARGKVGAVRLKLVHPGLVWK